ncbi:MAG TPA: alpha/beta fold hydrolase [Acidobacteriaceae bacterium]|nr:alpha/beta fold hydrolase [Acidobacteriaceae bacterium]
MDLHRLGVCAGIAMLGLSGAAYAAPSLAARACPSPELTQAGARCGVVEVREDPAKPDRKIGLNVVIVPALHPKPGEPPLFHLEGGPGIAATTAALFYAGPGSTYRQSQDVVLVDQRGTGGSGPLHCAAIENRSPLADELVARDVIACRRELSSQADLANYSTVRTAEDVDSVREALHAEQIDIWSISNGTRLAQQYIKAFPTRVRRAVMAGFVPLDYRTPLFHAMNAQRVVDLLIYKCRADPACSASYPNLEEEWTTVLARLDHSPAQVQWNGAPASLGRGRFTEEVRNSLSTAAGQRGFPALVHAAFGGDFGPFLHLLRKGSSPFAMGLYLTIACSEGGSRIEPADVQRYTEGTFLREYRVREELDACAEWPKYQPGSDFFQPPASSPELLVVSGEMDHVAPPDYAEQFCSRLEHCHLVIIPDLGHGPFDLDLWSGGDCYDTMTVKFLEDGVVDASCVRKMRAPAFR